MKKIIISFLILMFSSSSAFAFTIPKLNVLRNNKPIVNNSTGLNNNSSINSSANNITHSKNFNMLYHIHGNISLMPMIRVDFVRIPLWKVLQKLSSKTGYMFNSKRINLGENITIKGKYNFAELLNKLFRYDTVKIIPQNKTINIEGR